jgi:hypothetical protein
VLLPGCMDVSGAAAADQCGDRERNGKGVGLRLCALNVGQGRFPSIIKLLYEEAPPNLILKYPASICIVTQSPVAAMRIVIFQLPAPHCPGIATYWAVVKMP